MPELPIEPAHFERAVERLTAHARTVPFIRENYSLGQVRERVRTYLRLNPNSIADLRKNPKVDLRHLQGAFAELVPQKPPERPPEAPVRRGVPQASLPRLLYTVVPTDALSGLRTGGFVLTAESAEGALWSDTQAPPNRHEGVRSGQAAIIAVPTADLVRAGFIIDYSDPARTTVRRNPDARWFNVYPPSRLYGRVVIKPELIYARRITDPSFAKLHDLGLPLLLGVGAGAIAITAQKVSDNA